MQSVFLASADLDAFKASQTKIANWNYCKMETNETKQDPVEMLLKYLEAGKEGDSLYAEKCTLHERLQVFIEGKKTLNVASSNPQKMKRRVGHL